MGDAQLQPVVRLRHGALRLLQFVRRLPQLRREVVPNLKEVRKDPALKTLKVIVFMAAKGETAQLVLVPVDAELRRPFAMGDLLEAVQRVAGEP